MMSPIRIEIPAHDGSLTSTTPPARLSSPASPTKSPEEIAQAIANRSAKHQMMHDLHIENITARAKRANERVKESAARKLRLEAAKIEKASSKIERATKHVDAKQEEMAKRREEAKARRDALLESVRETRAAREADRLARQAALAELEDKASVKRAKAVTAVADKGRATVKHAVAVAAALKSKEQEDKATAATELQGRLLAAEQRRLDAHESFAAIGTWCAPAGALSPPARVRRWRHVEALSIDEKRVKYARNMGQAIGRRAARIDSIADRARRENERVLQVVSEIKEMRLGRPAALSHSLTARMQSAEVNRLNAQRGKIDAIVATAQGMPLTSSSVPASPKASPASSPPKPAANGSHKIRWLGPEGGCGRVPAVSKPLSAPATPLAKAAPNAASLGKRSQAVRPAVAFDIPAHLPQGRTLGPSAALLSRLLFRPRILLATATARQTVAAGRRTTMRALRVAKATFYGSTRVATVSARRAGRAEFMATLFRAREERGAQMAEQHLRRRAVRARLANSRVVSAAMRRSACRLALLNSCIETDARRQEATLRRTKRLLDLRAGRYAHVMGVAARARQAARVAAKAIAFSAAAKRCQAAASRRAAVLDYTIAKARACGTHATIRRVRATAGVAAAGPRMPAEQVKLTIAFDLSRYLTDQTVALQLEATTAAAKPLEPPTGGAKGSAEAAAALADLEERIAAQNAAVDYASSRTAAAKKASDALIEDVITTALTTLESGHDAAKPAASVERRPKADTKRRIRFNDETPILGGGGVGGAVGMGQALAALGSIQESLAARISAREAADEAKHASAKHAAWQRLADLIADSTTLSNPVKLAACTEAASLLKWTKLANKALAASALSGALGAAAAARTATDAAGVGLTSTAEAAVLNAAKPVKKGAKAAAYTVARKGALTAYLSAAEERAAAAVRDAESAVAEAKAAQVAVAELKSSLGCKAVPELVVIGKAVTLRKASGPAEAAAAAQESTTQLAKDDDCMEHDKEMPDHDEWQIVSSTSSSVASSVA